MKKLLLLPLLFIALYLSAQNDSIEKSELLNAYKINLITQEEFSKTGIKWLQFIKKNAYPVLPVDSNGLISYSFVVNFDTISKNYLYNRTLEWMAISYGLIPSYMYTNQSDGKIICTQSFGIPDSNKCTFTLVVTIKNGKMLLEFSNIDYEVKGGGYYSGETWVPEYNNLLDIELLYPVILKKPAEWDNDFKILKGVDNHINNDVLKLKDYILEYNTLTDF